MTHKDEDRLVSNVQFEVQKREVSKFADSFKIYVKNTIFKHTEAVGRIVGCFVTSVLIGTPVNLMIVRKNRKN